MIPLDERVSMRMLGDISYSIPIWQRPAGATWNSNRDNKRAPPCDEKRPFLFSRCRSRLLRLPHHLEMPVVAGVVGDVDELVADLGDHVDHPLVADEG